MFSLAPTTTPLPGVSVKALAGVFNELAIEAGNVPANTSMHIPTDLLSEYLAWVDAAERRLAGMLPPSDIESILLTRQHWALRSMDGATPGLASAVRLELEQRQRVLEHCYRDLESAHVRWESRSGTVAVPDTDTNVFLHQSQTIDELPWSDIIGSHEDVHVVVPLIVIDELDKLKRDNNKKLQRAARQSLRRLQSLVDDTPASPATAETSHGATVTIEVLVDPPQHRRLTDPDYEILGRVEPSGSSTR